MPTMTRDELITLERLTGRYYYQNGQPRSRHRTQREDQRLGIPESHTSAMIQQQVQHPVLRTLLTKIQN